MTGITAITRDWGDNVSIVRITTTSTLSQASAADYITAQHANIVAANNGEFEWLVSDMCLVYASNGWMFATISSDFTSLNPMVFSNNVATPVVVGDFAIFSSTGGNLEDLGYAPSDASKSVVVMANAAVTANHIAVFTDTAGTIDDDAATAINLGNLQAGASGTAGTVASFPGGATSGKLVLAAVTNSSGNFNTTISNASAVGQSQVVSVPDGGSATSVFLLSNSGGTQTIATGSLTLTLGNLTVSAGNIVATVGNITATAGNLTAGSSGHAGTVTSFPGTAANGSLILAAVNNSSNKTLTISNSGAVGQDTVLKIADAGLAAPFIDQSQSSATSLTNKVFVKTITATAAALATAGHVAVMAAPSGTSQFKILNIRVMYAAAGLSGGGGDRLLNLTDGTIVFNQNGITAALLGTPIYTLWGGTGNPLPGSVSTISTAGADIYLVYAGGGTDYTTGQIVIEVELAQVTA